MLLFHLTAFVCLPAQFGAFVGLIWVRNSKERSARATVMCVWHSSHNWVFLSAQSDGCAQMSKFGQSQQSRCASPVC